MKKKTAAVLRPVHGRCRAGAGTGRFAESFPVAGAAQTVKEVTATLEHRPAGHLILKLEGRHDRSSADVFARDALDADGAPLRKRSQFLVLLGAVAAF